ncbi:Copia protein (Gag-int-pol protein) [Cleaved into: Copia VLP protein [Durusdinium trenchii]|uniref:Copia protein (Gag-int-pol protein) [Cleaved into: Copia VLP protein n=1 Tax=Durusdinium trenchii TaxID=1381693 RepID=A0ABP0S8J2_9DINO
MLAILHSDDKADMENSGIQPDEVLVYLREMKNIYNSRSGIHSIHMIQALLNQKLTGHTPMDVKRFGATYTQKVREIEDVIGERLQHLLQVCGYLQAFPQNLRYITDHLKLNLDLHRVEMTQIRREAERLAVNHSLGGASRLDTDSSTSDTPNVALAAQHQKRKARFQGGKGPRKKRVPISCGRCGLKGHEGSECRRSKNTVCTKCGKKGHFSKMCTSKPLQRQSESNHDHESQESKSDPHHAFQVRTLGEAMMAVSALHGEDTAIIDSGASITLSPHADQFEELGPLDEDTLVHTASGDALQAQGKGTLVLTVAINGNTHVQLRVPNAYYMPSAATTLIAVRDLRELGHRLSFSRHESTLEIRNRAGDFYRISIPDNNTVNLLRRPQEHAFAAQNALTARLSGQVVHQRLGHLSYDTVRRTLATTVHSHGRQSAQSECTTCAIANITRAPSNTQEHAPRADAPRRAATVDVVGPFPKGPDGYIYAINFRDVYSDVAQTYPLKSLRDVAEALKHWRKDWLGYMSGKTTCRLFVDNASYFLGGDFNALLDTWGWTVTPCTAHAHQTHPAESINRTFGRIARALLHHAGFPITLWHWAYLAAAYIYNRVAKQRNPKTPHERHTGNKPDLRHMRVFGCIVVFRDPTPANKLAPRGKRGVFLGYHRLAPHGTYTIFSLSTRRVVHSRDAIFFEREFPTPAELHLLDRNAPRTTTAVPRQLQFPAVADFPETLYAPDTGATQQDSSPPPSQPRELPSSSADSVRSMIQRVRFTLPDELNSQPEPAEDRPRSGQEEAAKRLSAEQPIRGKRKRDRTSTARDHADEVQEEHCEQEEQRDHDDDARPRKVTRSGRQVRPAHHVNVKDMHGDSRTHKYFAYSATRVRLNDDAAPATYQDFRNMRPCERAKWQQAVDTEKDNIIRSGTLEAVLRSDASASTMRAKWIFKVKTNGAFKARLVVQGFNEPVERRSDLYTPCASRLSVRIATVIALTERLDTTTVDVAAAFLQAKIEDDFLFLEPPEGFDAPPDTVFRLRKSLYGLRSSPRRWMDHLSNTLKDIGLHPCPADHSLFQGYRNGVRILATVYVDDIRLFSSQDNLDHVVSELRKSFTITRDNGEEEGRRSSTTTETSLELPEQSHVRHRRAHRADAVSDRQLLPWQPSAQAETEQPDIQAQSRWSDSDYEGFYRQRAGCRHTVDERNSHKALQSQSTGAKRQEGVHDDPEHQLKTGPDGRTQHPVYRALVGSILFLGMTRPDICFATSMLCRHNHDHGRSHVLAAKRVLRYIKGTTKRGLTLKACQDLQHLGKALRVFTDASFAPAHSLGRKSTTGYIVALGASALKWATIRQPLTATSVFEAELQALHTGVQAAISIREILESIGVNTQTIKVFTDSRSVKTALEKGHWSKRTSHLSIRYFKLVELLRNDEIEVIHIEGAKHPADGLTKALPRQRFHELADKVLNAELSAHTL